MSPFLSLAVDRVGTGCASSTADQVVVEEPLEIRIGSRNLAITMRTPGHDEELAAGFLFTEGLIAGRSQIRSIEGAGNQVSVELMDSSDAIFDRQDRRFTMTSACGVCGKSSIDSLYAAGCAAVASGTFAIRAETLRTLPAALRNAQAVFDRTGGIHAAALLDRQGELVLVREDVGRHNAVDKLIGAFLLGPAASHHSARPSAPDHLLLVSGRASFELVQKAAMAGIPILAAVGAPSTLAVETARRFNITLVGFLRDDRFNIYTAPERIVTA